MAFIFVISFLVLQRLAELVIARSNERWLLKKGAVEYGHDHYKWIVLMHTAFIASLILDYLWRDSVTVNYFFLAVYFVLVAVKAWVIYSLGRYWNTKIFRVPGTPPVRRGLYKFIKHPNYVIVVLELLIIPLIFGLFVTAAIFTVLNAMVLSIRIKEENKVWAH